MDKFLSRYFSESIQILERLDKGKIEFMIELLLRTRDRTGRLIILFVGGSAANVCPFRQSSKVGIILTYAY